jgi:hypothetical protein
VTRRKKMSEEDKWLGDYGNIISLANFLVEVKGFDTENLLYFIEKPYKFDIEKPYKFDDEYKEMKYYHENDIYPYGDNEFTGFVNPHLQDKKSEEVHS